MANNVDSDGRFGEDIIRAADENILKMSPLVKLYRRSVASCTTEKQPTTGCRQNLADLNSRSDRKLAEGNRHQSPKDSMTSRGNKVDGGADGRWQSQRNRYAKSSRNRRQTWPDSENAETQGNQVALSRRHHLYSC